MAIDIKSELEQAIARAESAELEIRDLNRQLHDATRDLAIARRVATSEAVRAWKASMTRAADELATTRSWTKSPRTAQKCVEAAWKAVYAAIDAGVALMSAPNSPAERMSICDVQVGSATQNLIAKVEMWAKAHRELNEAQRVAQASLEQVDRIAVRDAEDVCQARYGDLFDAVGALMRRAGGAT